MMDTINDWKNIVDDVRIKIGDDKGIRNRNDMR